jgi:hypothetical protein
MKIKIKNQMELRPVPKEEQVAGRSAAFKIKEASSSSLVKRLAEKCLNSGARLLKSHECSTWKVFIAVAHGALEFGAQNFLFFQISSSLESTVFFWLSWRVQKR